MLQQQIVLVAAENGALVGGKVGSVGDLIQHLPSALARLGCQITVITPSYGTLHRASGARQLTTVSVPFRGEDLDVKLFQVPTELPNKSIRHWVLHHREFAAAGRGVIYTSHDGDPFAIDASKFALFSQATAELLIDDPEQQPDAVHVHDWHTAFLLMLRAAHPRYRMLQSLHFVFSIHNLALQGVRPFTGGESSLQAWYPQIDLGACAVAEDPRSADCINPMLAGITMSDQVHTVSPSYAGEILTPSDAEIRGFSGGEGLDATLRDVHARGRLHGILNGCDYPDTSRRAERARNLRGGRAGALPQIKQWGDFLCACRRELTRWAAQKPALRSSHFVAGQRVDELTNRPVARLLTSVTHVTAQKVTLLLHSTSNGRSALENILDAIGGDSLYVLLGSGQGEFEHALTRVSAERENFLFLNGYSDTLANALYSRGDLFLMPSSFEPCGTSQMIAMRHGQPCLVHGVGGLRDTVSHGKSGFVFQGNNLFEQADNFVQATIDALRVQRNQTEHWRAIRSNAAAERFTWEVTARKYKDVLYAKEPVVEIA